MKSTTFFRSFVIISLMLFLFSAKAQNNFMDFDGNNDYINLGDPDPLNITGNLTIEMWINPETLGGSTRRNPYAKAYGGEGTITLEPSGYLNFYWGRNGGNGSPYQGFTSGTPLSAGTWAHIAIVRDLTNNVLTWYINGVPTSTTTPAYSAAIAGNNTAYIGNGYTNPFNGQMDELRIWNVARTQSEIQSAMNYELSGDESGLVAYYNFNQGVCGGSNTGINTLPSIGPYEVNGTITNFSMSGCNSNFVCSSSCGYASNNVEYPSQVFMDFDGNDYINLGDPAALNITGDLTIEMWLNPDNFSARRNPFAKAYGGEGTITQETNGYLHFYYGQSGTNSSPYQSFLSGDPLTLNQWNHIAIVRDLTSGVLRWYINGNLSSTATAAYNTAVSGGNSALIGEGYVSGYDGQIDEVRIWNTARTQTEIQDNMNRELAGNESGLVAYYPFNEGVCGGDNSSISTVIDRGPNGLNGSVVGFSKTGCASNWVCEACDYDTSSLGLVAVPTLSQWGMIILLLLVLCIESAVIWNKKYCFSKR